MQITFHKITLQTKSSGSWEDAAEVYLQGSEQDGTNAETRLEYQIDYAQRDFQLNHIAKFIRS